MRRFSNPRVTWPRERVDPNLSFDGSVALGWTVPRTRPPTRRGRVHRTRPLTSPRSSTRRGRGVDKLPRASASRHRHRVRTTTQGQRFAASASTLDSARGELPLADPDAPTVLTATMHGLDVPVAFTGSDGTASGGEGPDRVGGTGRGEQEEHTTARRTSRNRPRGRRLPSTSRRVLWRVHRAHPWRRAARRTALDARAARKNESSQSRVI